MRSKNTNLLGSSGSRRTSAKHAERFEKPLAGGPSDHRARPRAPGICACGSRPSPRRPNRRSVFALRLTQWPEPALSRGVLPFCKDDAREARATRGREAPSLACEARFPRASSLPIRPAVVVSSGPLDHRDGYWFLHVAFRIDGSALDLYVKPWFRSRMEAVVAALLGHAPTAE
jgi:hypothetical protein